MDSNIHDRDTFQFQIGINVRFIIGFNGELPEGLSLDLRLYFL